jgi:transcriptional regulator with XRE-family HTH domain
MDEPKPMRELTRTREERGLSQQGLADASGVNKATINQIERGRRSPNVDTLEKLADALTVEIADFFPKAQAPLFREPPERDFPEERRGDAYDVALDAARRQAVQDRQAASRALESSRAQSYFIRHENEAAMELLKYPADELAGALLEATGRYVELEENLLSKVRRLERQNKALTEQLTKARRQPA